MKVPSATDKPKNILELLSGTNEAVKISTKGNTSAQVRATDDPALSPTELAKLNEKATSIKLGLAKYLADELDPQKVTQEREVKIADIKARIANGSYLSPISSEDVSSKLLDDSRLENLIAGNE